jgi:hypothetical protein
MRLQPWRDQRRRRERNDEIACSRFHDLVAIDPPARPEFHDRRLMLGSSEDILFAVFTE